jgi:L-threonylcarbamoyladenylate synthase
MSTALDQAADAIARGGIIAYPTDTLWGLGASLRDEKAIRRVFEIKQRPLEMPLSIAVPDVTQIDQYAIVTPTARRLFEFLPGPITLILEKRPSVPSILTAGKNEVGIRVPAHAECLELLSRTGAITTTSANIHARGEPKTLADVRATFGDRVDYYLEAGSTPTGAASTIVDARSEPLRFIRTGVLSESRIRQALAH